MRRIKIKTRSGFVSNSSSSSFIVAFPKNIELTTKAVQDYLFKDQKYIIAYDDPVDTATAAGIIYEAMKEQEPNNTELILEAIDGWYNGCPNYDDFLIPENDKPKHYWKTDWDDYTKACNETKLARFEQFKTSMPDPTMDLYVFEFSDNHGHLYSTLEHGDTFDRVYHLKTSHH